MERKLQKGDPLLGLLEFDPDEEGWVATPAQKGVRLIVGGDTEPDPKLIASARRFVEDYDRFVAALASFLDQSALQQPQAAAEIRALAVSAVCFYWPDKADTAMVFFDGPDESRSWHCDYYGGQLAYLTFDS